jgi:serine protease Do
VAAQDEFVNMVQSTKPGTTVTIRVLRDGKQVDVKATVEAMAAAPAQKRTPAVEPQKLGISVEAAPEDVLNKANLTGGVRVRAVDPVSDAARAGLQAGDIIITVNRADITDVASYQRAVSTLKKGDPTIIRIWRGGHQQTLEIESISE